MVTIMTRIILSGQVRFSKTASHMFELSEVLWDETYSLMCGNTYIAVIQNSGFDVIFLLSK